MCASKTWIQEICLDVVTFFFWFVLLLGWRGNFQSHFCFYFVGIFPHKKCSPDVYDACGGGAFTIMRSLNWEIFPTEEILYYYFRELEIVSILGDYKMNLNYILVAIEIKPIFWKNHICFFFFELQLLSILLNCVEMSKN